MLYSINLSKLKNLEEIHLKVHDGLDGSGGHSIFNQKNNAHTNNIIMYMFRFENATLKDGSVIWDNKRHGSASTCRTVMLLLGKESCENCQIMKSLQEERKSHHFTFTLDKKQFTVFFFMLRCQW